MLIDKKGLLNIIFTSECVIGLIADGMYVSKGKMLEYITTKRVSILLQNYLSGHFYILEGSILESVDYDLIDDILYVYLMEINEIEMSQDNYLFRSYVYYGVVGRDDKLIYEDSNGLLILSRLLNFITMQTINKANIVFDIVDDELDLDTGMDDAYYYVDRNEYEVDEEDWEDHIEYIENHD
ncbi:hypothetical protein [Paenibacillus sp. An7]|uniref:hypothetical protein n=1 Tax=Paenibacillus sp. An7 TaxID=2689577 RepID=UPI001359C5E0|nr:hypothetical protein [Paenibacillus sp. An7]